MILLELGDGIGKRLIAQSLAASFVGLVGGSVLDRDVTDLADSRLFIGRGFHRSETADVLAVMLIVGLGNGIVHRGAVVGIGIVIRVGRGHLVKLHRRLFSFRYSRSNRCIVSRCRTVIMYGTTNRIAQQAFFGRFIGMHGILHALQAVFFALLCFREHVSQIAHDLTLRLGVLLFLFGQTHLGNISDFTTLGDAHLPGLFGRKDPVDTAHKHIVGRVGTGNLVGLHGTRNRTARNTSRLIGNNRFPLTGIHLTGNGGTIVATANRGLNDRSTTRGRIGSARYNSSAARTGVVDNLLVRKPGQLGVIVIHYEILLRVEMSKREMVYQ